MTDECLICSAPLVYLDQDDEMECAICHKREASKTRCINGHFVCNDCHTQGVASILSLCLIENSCAPLEILEKMMEMPFCHMHGPEHHVMVGAALLTAYHNAGGKLNLEQALNEMFCRGKSVPGGACGFWGTCGAAISTGQFLSIATSSTPLSVESWGLCNRMTAKALDSIGNAGGPRCCKRDSYLAVLEAIDFVAEHLQIQLKKTFPMCTRSAQNSQCIGNRCPFNGGSR